MTASQMTLEAIRSVPLFASLDDEAAAELRNLLSDRIVPQNTRLFRKGDKGDGMYLIESGRVRISIQDDDQHELTLAELAQGDFFGEMSIIDGRQRSADANVVEDARLAVLSRDAFLSFVRTNPDVALEMLSALTDRLRRTDELLRSRVSRNVNEEAQARSTVADRAADLADGVRPHDHVGRRRLAGSADGLGRILDRHDAARHPWPAAAVVALACEPKENPSFREEGGGVNRPRVSSEPGEPAHSGAGRGVAGRERAVRV